MDSIVDNKYIDQYKVLHKNNKSYGTTALNLLKEVSLIIRILKPKYVLDYGCGKGLLVDELSKLFPLVNFYKYDPSIEKWSSLPQWPKKFDLIINTDVLEHIPEPTFYNVIENIFSLSKNIFFNLHHGKAITVLPDGSNAHCTIKNQKEYYRIFKKYTNTIYRLPTKNKINSIFLTFEIPQFYFDLKKIKIIMLSQKKLHVIYLKNITNFINNQKVKNDRRN